MSKTTYVATFDCGEEHFDVQFESDAKTPADLRIAAGRALASENKCEHTLMVAIMQMADIKIRKK